MKEIDNLFDEDLEETNIDISMAWTRPEYSREQVNNAAKILFQTHDPSIMGEDLAYAIINNWRTSHNFPLNTFQIRLRRIAKEIDGSALVVQRIKRLSSIELKLNRFPNMKLSQIQDIGGCRAIMSNVSKVNSLVQVYQKNTGVKHRQASIDNYIINPKNSGYRGVHLVYKYQSDKNTHYEGLKIEIQIRTLLQHAWATAVETVGTFTDQSLKSSQGAEDWLRFFVLMGSVIAIKEKTPIIPCTPSDPLLLKAELNFLENKLHVRKTLDNFGATLKFLEQPLGSTDAHYYLIELTADGRVKLRSYQKHELDRASKEYLNAERDIPRTGANVVLVSADSLDGLRKAYPNYFLDTKLFTSIVNGAVL